MDTSPRTRILLIEDDEDDYVLVKDLLSEIDPSKYHLEWETSYEAAVNAICLNHHDVYLLDYRLGERNGLELLREVMEKGCLAPIIFLTGQGDYDVDMKAMKGGAADYLIKDQINPSLLERSIRYAIDRKRSEEVLRESESQLKHLSSQLLNAQEAERDDERGKDIFRHAHQLREELGRNQTGQYHDQVAEQHAGKDGVNRFGGFSKKQRARLNTMEKKGPHHNGRSSAAGDSQGQEGNHGAPGRTVDGGL